MNASRQAESPRRAGETEVRRWAGLVVVILGIFMQLLDVGVVNVAIPSIQRTLGASDAQVQWVVAGYLLAFGTLLITGGRLGDIYGRKRAFLIGVAGFTAASVACALAPSPDVLIGARVVQGVLGALMYPQAFSVVQVSFPDRQRATAFGVAGGVIGLATIAGPLVGGALVSLNVAGLAWRPIFLVNVPVGVVTLIAGAAVLRESRAPSAPRLDVLGVLLGGLGLLFLLAALVEGRELGWRSPALVALAVPLLMLFVRHERRMARSGGSPLVDLALFADRSVVVGLLMSLCFFAGTTAFPFSFAIFLQSGLGFSALQSGLTTAPTAVFSALASAGSAWLVPRLGRHTLWLGTALVTLGMIGVILTLHLVGADLQSWQILPALAVCGLGTGATVAPLIDVILASGDAPVVGSASGVLSTAQQVGSALGIAAMSALFFGLLAGRADASAARVIPQLRHDLQALGLPASARDTVANGFRLCFDDRMAQSDPSTVPPSCGPGELGPGEATPSSGVRARIQGAVHSGEVEARRQDFATSIQWALWYEVAVFAASLALTLPLSRGSSAGGRPPRSHAWRH